MKRNILINMRGLPDEVARLCVTAGLLELSDVAKLYLDTERLGLRGKKGNMFLKLDPSEFDLPVKRLAAMAVVSYLLSVYERFSVEVGVSVRWFVIKTPTFIDFTRVWDTFSYREDMAMCVKLGRQIAIRDEYKRNN